MSGTGAGGSAGASSSASSASDSSSGSGASGSSGPAASNKRARVDLWDSGWPSGRYYWTVVPITVFKQPTDNTDPTADIAIGYQDATFPQDACEAGQKMSFGKVSSPVVTSAGRPFVSGIAPGTRLMAAAGSRPVVYSSPIVAWQPAIGATKYQVELSRSLYPWRVVTKLTTPATSIMLPLSKYVHGTWYYRVRAINQAFPVGAQKMSWSAPVQVQVTGDRFSVVK